MTSAPADPVRPRRAKPKQPLSPERIFDVATTIIDADGIEALTMRRLAQDLGVAATAIYWHVRTRDDLLRGVLERIIDQVEMPSADEVFWEEGLRTVCRSLSEVLSHPHIVALSHRVPSNASFKLFHRMVEILVGAGFDTRDAVESALLLQTFVFGFAAARSSAVSPTSSVTMSPESLASWFRASGTESAMLLDLYLTIDYDDLFERGIENHLSGLRGALETKTAKPARPRSAPKKRP